MEELFRNLPKFRPFALQIFTLIDEWARAYGVPREEIIRQLPWAHGWILSNPQKAPKKNIVRFLFNWMRKAHQMGNLRQLRAPELLHHELPPETTTEDDLVWMHDQKIKALGACRAKDCRFCPKVQEAPHVSAA